MGKRTRRGDLARARKAMNKATANVPALRRLAERQVLKAKSTPHELFEDLARFGGMLTKSLHRERGGELAAADPEDRQREWLLGYLYSIGTVLKHLALPRASRQGLRMLLMEIKDLLDGRQAETLRPLNKGPGHRPDPNRDWWARAELALLAERTKRLMRLSPKNADASDQEAYAELLPRINDELARFGLTVGDVLPGTGPDQKPTSDQENKPEEWKRAQMLAVVANRCVRHKAALDGSSNKTPPPAMPLLFWQTKLCEIDQEENAGTLAPVSDDEIFDIGLDLRLSFDARDHERKLAKDREPTSDRAA